MIDVLIGLVMGWRWVDSLFTEVVLTEDRPDGGTIPEPSCTPLLPRDADDIPITHDWDAGLEELVASYAANAQTV